MLRQKAGDVDLAKLKSSQEIKRVLVTMRAVMKHYRSAGISAPQIGIPLRIIMIEFPEEMGKRFPEGVYQAREMSPIPFQVPFILHFSNESISFYEYENCLNDSYMGN